MPKPITPMCGCDVFVTDSESRVLLVKRVDNGLWALPGGCQNLDDTPQECAVRECFEETGYNVQVTHLLGTWSSLRYIYVHYPHKENVFTHLVFAAKVVGGCAKVSEETSAVSWFALDKLPALSDGHDIRLNFCLKWLKEPKLAPYFE